jgi:hypothetical protein
VFDSGCGSVHPAGEPVGPIPAHPGQVGRAAGYGDPGSGLADGGGVEVVQGTAALGNRDPLAVADNTKAVGVNTGDEQGGAMASARLRDFTALLLLCLPRFAFPASGCDCRTKSPHGSAVRTFGSGQRSTNQDPSVVTVR